jgi:hypothetical protein
MPALCTVAADQTASLLPLQKQQSKKQLLPLTLRTASLCNAVA